MFLIVLLIAIHAAPLASAGTYKYHPFPRFLQGNNTDEIEALHFLEMYDREATEMCTFLMESQWDFNTNISEENRYRMLETHLDYAKYQKDVWQGATSFAWKTFRDPHIRRQFRMLAVLGRAALEEDKLTEIQQVLNDMRNIYSQTRVCPYIKQPKNRLVRPDVSECNLAIDTDVNLIMAKSKDEQELRHIWKYWHEETGRSLRSNFIRYVELSNEGARLNGFNDLGDYWRSAYDVEDLPIQLEQLWKTVKPLYEQLHTYIRRKLHQQYGPLVPLDGPIPAHLLGNMWGQTWVNLYNITAPFPEKASIDITPVLQQQGYDATRVFHLADEYFVSLGMKPVPDSFWTDSMLEKPADRDVVCHASAWDFCNGKDFRIKQCTEVTMADYITAHHELGHIQYYMQYVDQPLVFRDGANPGFHEAVGDVIALSVSTPEHLQKIGLLDDADHSAELDLNHLYSIALDKIAFLPFGYLLDQWRWRIFSGQVPFERMNEYWWDLRLAYQGVSPPVPRSEEDFDPGAKYHVPANTPYIRYFISYIMQFQIHKVLCQASGHVGPLHKCDIYGSKEAGRILGDVLRMGSSRPWPDAIKVLTKGRSNRMDAGAIVEYFQPLMDWLQEQNKMEHIGWEKRPVTANSAIKDHNFMHGRQTNNASKLKLYSVLVLPLTLFVVWIAAFI